MFRPIHAILAAFMAMSSLLAPIPVKAADLAASYDENSGECANPGYLGRITNRFAYQVRHVPNLPDVAIVDYQRIHEHRYLPSSEEWPIERRYCGATVVLSDGRTRDLWYLIEGRMGFAGIGKNVEFCVSGFDRWMVYNGRCRVLR